MKHIAIVIMGVGLFFLISCGSTTTDSAAESDEETSTNTSDDSEDSTYLYGTFIYNEDYPDSTYAGIFEGYCYSTCGLSMWPTVLLYRNDETSDVSITDTNNNTLFSVEMIDENFTYSFGISGSEDEVSCTATISDEESNCAADTYLVSYCNSDTTGYCTLFYEML